MHSCAAIVDMEFMWQMCFPSAEDREKNDESHFTWRDYASKIFSSIMSRHIDASTIIFVNDPYNIAEVIIKKLIQLYALSHIFCISMASSIR